MNDPDNRPAAEHALIAAEAILSTTPFTAWLVTLLQSYIPATWQTRQEAVLRKLSEDMKRFEGRLKDQRLRSEDFHITMVKVIRDSIVELHATKQEAFRAILLNDAMASSANAETDLFIKITEDLTGDHIRMLKILADPNRACQTNPDVQRSLQSLSIGGLSELLRPALPDIAQDHWAILIEGLYAYGLVHTGRGSLGVTTTKDGILQKKTTPLGDRYIQFITMPQ